MLMSIAFIYSIVLFFWAGIAGLRWSYRRNRSAALWVMASVIWPLVVPLMILRWAYLLLQDILAAPVHSRKDGAP
jgi:uncharacterized membrane protein